MRVPSSPSEAFNPQSKIIEKKSLIFFGVVSNAPLEFDLVPIK